MTSKKFPNYLFEAVLTGGDIELGTFTIDESGELDSYVMTMIFYRTDLFTTEGFRLKLVRSNIATPIVSQVFTPSTEISNFQDTSYWLGDVKFSFDRQALKLGTTVNVKLEGIAYSHSHSGTQVGALLNYIDSSTGQFDVASNKAAYVNQFIYR